MNRKIKKSFAAVLSTVLITGTVCGALPLYTEAEKTVQQIEDEKKALQQSINDTNSQLVNVIAKMNEITADIAEKEAEIAETNENIQLMQEAVDKQHNLIKLRMKNNYENNGDNNVFKMMLESKSIADFLSNVEYANSIYKYDNDLMETYQGTQRELEGMKAMAEQEETELETKKGELSAQQSTLNAILESKKDKMGDINAELQKAKEEAARKERERQERLRREREAEIARIAAQEAARRNNNSGSGRGSGSGSGGSGGGSGSYDKGSDAGKNLNPGAGTDGNAIVAYAKQFVGNPYVWGGNSLTNGCDCSGFTHLVYEHFGISTPRHSQAFLNWGKPVSFENIQPGDVVVYPGHVAIYAGGGVIVEAQSPKAGITIGRSVLCHNISGIRRY